MPPFDFYIDGMNPVYDWQTNWGVNSQLAGVPLNMNKLPNTSGVTIPSSPNIAKGPSIKDRVNGYFGKYATDKGSMIDGAIGAGTQVLGNIINSGGLSSGVGNVMSGIGNVVGNIPGPIGWAGKALSLVGAGVNALWGHKFNDANVAAAESANRERNNWQFGDYSNTDALLAGSMANVQLGNVSKGFLGKEGPFSNAVTNKMKQINNDRMQANLRANNSELNAYNNYQTGSVRNAISTGSAVNAAASGGPLSMISGTMTPFGNRYFADGGFTHGSLFNNGLIKINNGGSHEQNPNQGVQYGVDPQGTPNMVEEGETVLDDYVFSDRIKFPNIYKQEFSFGGKLENKTFADISKIIAKESEERPNDPTSIKTLKAMGGRLADIQEEVKARQALNQMDPREVMAILQQIGAMNSYQQPEIQAGIEQPIMAAYGGNLYAIGGRRRRPVERTDEVSRVSNLGRRPRFRGGTRRDRHPIRNAVRNAKNMVGDAVRGLQDLYDYTLGGGWASTKNRRDGYGGGGASTIFRDEEPPKAKPKKKRLPPAYWEGEVSIERTRKRNKSNTKRNNNKPNKRTGSGNPKYENVPVEVPTMMPVTPEELLRDRERILTPSPYEDMIYTVRPISGAGDTIPTHVRMSDYSQYDDMPSVLQQAYDRSIDRDMQEYNRAAEIASNSIYNNPILDVLPSIGYAHGGYLHNNYRDRVPRIQQQNYLDPIMVLQTLSQISRQPRDFDDSDDEYHYAGQYPKIYDSSKINKFAPGGGLIGGQYGPLSDTLQQMYDKVDWKDTDSIVNWLGALRRKRLVNDPFTARALYYLLDDTYGGKDKLIPGQTEGQSRADFFKSILSGNIENGTKEVTTGTGKDKKTVTEIIPNLISKFIDASNTDFDTRNLNNADINLPLNLIGKLRGKSYTYKPGDDNNNADILDKFFTYYGTNEDAKIAQLMKEQMQENTSKVKDYRKQMDDYLSQLDDQYLDVLTRKQLDKEVEGWDKLDINNLDASKYTPAQLLSMKYWLTEDMATASPEYKAIYDRLVADDKRENELNRSPEEYRFTPYYTGTRLLPAFLSTVGVLTDGMRLTNTADLTPFRSMMGIAGKSKEVPTVRSPFGNYDISPEPLARNFHANALMNKMTGADRTLENLYGANAGAAGAGVIANNNNAYANLGNMWRADDEYNFNNLRTAMDHNRTGFLENAKNSLNAQMFNTKTMQEAYRDYLRGAGTGLGLYQTAMQDSNKNISTNLTHAANSWANWGKENMYMNMINSNKAFDYWLARNGISGYKYLKDNDDYNG